MMNLRQAASAMAGELRGIDRHFIGVSTDTRAIAAGELFFALKGERYDAAQFIGQACAAGAAGVVVGRASAAVCHSSVSVIVVDDARAALGHLAAYWRRRFTVTLVGLTGSNGKTTVKDMIAAVLHRHCSDPLRVLATEGNLNNDIGVPLTLLKLRDRHRYAVIEMGMNHSGEIRYLTGLARPDVALVNNAGTAHIGILGSRGAIAQAKAEIYEGLAAEGIALVNADDAYATMWRELNASRTVIDFGLDASSACVTGRYQGHALHSDIVVTTPAGQARFRLGLPGEHNVRNAIAAAAATFALDVPTESIAGALGSFQGPKGRMQQLRGANQSILIDDTYNANPDSTMAAIAVLAGMSGKRLLVLGDMGELGQGAAEAHRRVGEAAQSAGLDRLYTLGDLSEQATRSFGAEARHFACIEDLLTAVGQELGPQTTLLVKGSRFMRMERVVQSFKVEQA